MGAREIVRVLAAVLKLVARAPFELLRAGFIWGTTVAPGRRPPGVRGKGVYPQSRLELG